MAQSKPPTNQQLQTQTASEQHDKPVHQTSDAPHTAASTPPPSTHKSQRTSAVSRKRPTLIQGQDKCPQQYSTHNAHTRAGTLSPQQSRHSMYAAQASCRTQLKRLAWYKRRMNKASLPPYTGRAPRPPEGRVRGGGEGVRARRGGRGGRARRGGRIRMCRITQPYLYGWACLVYM